MLVKWLILDGAFELRGTMTFYPSGTIGCRPHLPWIFIYTKFLAYNSINAFHNIIRGGHHRQETRDGDSESTL